MMKWNAVNNLTPIHFMILPMYGIVNVLIIQGQIKLF